MKKSDNNSVKLAVLNLLKEYIDWGKEIFEEHIKNQKKMGLPTIEIESSQLSRDVYYLDVKRFLGLKGNEKLEIESWEDLKNLYLSLGGNDYFHDNSKLQFTPKKPLYKLSEAQQMFPTCQSSPQQIVKSQDSNNNNESGLKRKTIETNSDNTSQPKKISTCSPNNSKSSTSASEQDEIFKKKRLDKIHDCLKCAEIKQDKADSNVIICFISLFKAINFQLCLLTFGISQPGMKNKLLEPKKVSFANENNIKTILYQFTLSETQFGLFDYVLQETQDNNTLSQYN